MISGGYQAFLFSLMNMVHQIYFGVYYLFAISAPQPLIITNLFLS